jgi:ribosomal protein S6
MLIFDPNLGEEKIGELVSKIEGRIKSLGGEVEKTDKWGVRKLPGRMKKAKKLTQAHYVLIYFKSESSLPKELQGFLKVTENVVRYSIFQAVPKAAAAEVPSAEEGGGIEAVNVGEIKEVRPASGESLGES